MTWKYNIFLKARLTHNGQFYPSFFLSKSHIAEVPNSGKILLYWLFRSKIWYFRVIWLFTAKFFKKLVFFLCFLEGRGKKSKQNNTAWFSPNSLVFSSFRYCGPLWYCCPFGFAHREPHMLFLKINFEIQIWLYKLSANVSIVIWD